MIFKARRLWAIRAARAISAHLLRLAVELAAPCATGGGSAVQRAAEA
jgi:hypothetical protein